jgi:2-polyprenyl-3-methyl-5-hydroxy-6-metoxy-1,4-benzoquinol methylase
MSPWLLSNHQVAKDEGIVDIGAGQGHCLLPLYENGWLKLTAVDVDDYNFSIFKNKYGFNVHKCNISSEKLGLTDNSQGAVICFHLIEHLLSPDNLIKEAHRVLRPGGKMFIVTPDWRKQFKTFWRDPTHLHPYDKESIARLLRMYNYDPIVYSWGSAYGLGRLKAYKYLPKLGLVRSDILAVGIKVGN